MAEKLFYEDINKKAMESFEINKDVMMFENYTLKDLYTTGYFQGFLSGMKEMRKEQNQEKSENSTLKEYISNLTPNILSLPPNLLRGLVGLKPIKKGDFEKDE